MSKQQNIVGQVFKKRYQINRKLKSGGFASVYLAKDLQQKNKFVAVKLMQPKYKLYAEMEIKMYEKIKENNYTFGFVKYFDHGLQNGKYFIIIQLLDKDLDEVILLAKNHRFSLKTTLMIGLQVVDRLEALHKIGYLHRDIKPDNLLIGFEEKNKVIYLIDFGLAKKIEQSRPEEKNKLIGSLGFMSCRAHEGKQIGISDQIQSLIYTMLFLVNGTLPWSKLQINTTAETHKILLMKKKLSSKDFKTSVVPSELIEILDKMKSTPITQKVDYLFIKFKMLEILKSIKAQNDFSFDWVKNSSCSNSKLKAKRIVSPQKIQREKLKQQNQKQIQSEIYQVYKFLDKGQKNQQRSPSKKKLNLVERENSRLDRNKKQSSKEKTENKFRNINQLKAENKKMNPQTQQNLKKDQTILNSMTQKYMNMKLSGPNIIINKTERHKI